ncbi:MAG: hypothetical protein QOG86_1709 [Thermoleophilaceae bacterium]|nr:hypothetical protein [Thermoleophilaceae bacterium]
MGCHVCGTRQTDPVRGASPWQRGVVAGAQVLGCPDCQRSGAWGAALDRCAGCGSAALVRRLGETSCRDCGHAGDGVAAGGGAANVAARGGVAPGGADPGGTARDGRGGLAEEVSAALDRFFGRA